MGNAVPAWSAMVRQMQAQVISARIVPFFISFGAESVAAIATIGKPARSAPVLERSNVQTAGDAALRQSMEVSDEAAPGTGALRVRTHLWQ